MAAPATATATETEVFQAEVREVLLAISGVVKQDNHEEEEEEMRRRRRLHEQFMSSFGPGAGGRCVAVVVKVQYDPCVLYTMKVSVKKARISWSHRSSRRFVPERRGHSYPIVLCRAVDHDHVEQVMHGSGVPGEPDRPGVLSGIHQADYYLHELSREMAVVQKEGSSALWKEVAVIRGMPGGRGITVTTHVDHLVVRLHDLLFSLAVRALTVDIRFSEQWFCLPAGWTEERLFAEDGLHFVDIEAPVESLVRRLYEMRKEEDQEMERRRSETEEERAVRVRREEEARREQEEERRKILQRKKEERRRRQEEEAARPPVYPVEWRAVLGKISDAQPPGMMHCSSSRFNLSMNSKKRVFCECVREEEGFQYMLRRVDDGDYILPISKTAAPISGSSSGAALQLLGFVEGYSSLGNCRGFGPTRWYTRDQSGCTLSFLLFLSRSTAKVLTLVFFVDKLNVLLDDGLVLSGGFNVAVDICCDDVSSSELLAADWEHHIVCNNIGGDGMISFSTLLAHLKKKLQLQLTEEELRLYSLSATAIDGEEEIEEFPRPQKPKPLQWTPRKPKPELPEVELRECSTLFPTEF